MSEKDKKECMKILNGMINCALKKGLSWNRMNALVNVGIENGWAWEYKYNVRPRKSIFYKIFYREAVWKNFQSEISKEIGVPSEYIESVAITNSSKDYSEFKNFVFEKKDTRKSKHIYLWIKIIGNWYGPLDSCIKTPILFKRGIRITAADHVLSFETGRYKQAIKFLKSKTSQNTL